LRNTKIKCTAIILASLVAPGLANAETASDFLKSLQGDYSGRGKATLIGKNAEKIACKITNTFDETAGKLVVDGECASTKGKDRISGSVTAANNTFDGAFVGPRKGMTVTQSSGSYTEGQMVLNASMIDDSAGKLTRVRQVISRSSDGIVAKFFTFDNRTQSYEESGDITLNKR
jgi:hypothetical protein